MTPKIVSLFSGCGGLDYGFHLEGYETAWAIDSDKWACQTFAANLGDVVHFVDITRINPYEDETIPDCDLILGGFPCQDFSVVGRHEGLKGRRGELYRFLVDFIGAKKPKAFVAENVKGLLYANKGEAVKAVVEAFDAVAPGYLVKPRIYRFAEYGVPQFRERVLFVGIRLDTMFDFVHPRPTHGPRAELPYVTAGEALKGVEDVAANNERAKIAEKTRRRLEVIPEGGNVFDLPSDEFRAKSLFKNNYRRIQRDRPSPTITANGGGGTEGFHYPENRPLTNRERARIQSFPDDFVFRGYGGSVRRQIGNAVPPQGVRALAKALLPLFTGDYETTDLRQEYERVRKMTVKERLKYVESQLETQEPTRVGDAIADIDSGLDDIFDRNE